MTIEVKINKIDNHKIVFPALMCNVDRDLIILATGNRENGCFKGIVIASKNNYPIGYFDDEWTNDLIPFDGEITLYNIKE